MRVNARVIANELTSWKLIPKTLRFGILSGANVTVYRRNRGADVSKNELDGVSVVYGGDVE